MVVHVHHWRRGSATDLLCSWPLWPLLPQKFAVARIQMGAVLPIQRGRGGSNDGGAVTLEVAHSPAAVAADGLPAERRRPHARLHAFVAPELLERVIGVHHRAHHTPRKMTENGSLGPPGCPKYSFFFDFGGVKIVAGLCSHRASPPLGVNRPHQGFLRGGTPNNRVFGDHFGVHILSITSQQK